jgi:hypothetical protein
MSDGSATEGDTPAEVVDEQSTLEEDLFRTERERPVPRKEAFYGPVGEAALLLASESESDPAALLLTLLVALANIIGPTAHAITGNSRHPARLYGLITGPTSSGRKGTAWDDASSVLQIVDPNWYRVPDGCRRSGHASGEALVGDYDESKNPVLDKRGFALETEFARLISSMNREGAILSDVYRQAYDYGTMEVRRVRGAVVAAGAHLGLLGHITLDELTEKLKTIEMVNGFGNRILYCYSRRTRKLSDGGNPDVEKIAEIANRLAIGIEKARENVYDIRTNFTPDAKAAYSRFYNSLPEDSRGFIESLTARAESHVIRLCIVFAILDGSEFVRIEHFQAALAVWDYSKECVEYIFGEDATNPHQVRILDYLQAKYPYGHTQKEIYQLFNCKLQARVIRVAIESLKKDDKIQWRIEKGKGRPATRYFALRPRKGNRPPSQTYSKSFHEAPPQRKQDQLPDEQVPF